MEERKTAQLQIRISPADKRRLARAARRAGKDMSTYVLDLVLPSTRLVFERVLARLRPGQSHELAELSDLLAGLGKGEFIRVVGERPGLPGDGHMQNLVAAMIEHRAHQLGTPAPRWTGDIAPTREPFFGTSMIALRAHLLRSAPVAYRRRGLFVDAGVGDRV